MLMRLCKIKARSKGYYSDEPQYKSYCTKLYNATKEGKGIAGLAGDANNEATAERLTKLFKAIGFPYRVEASGKFLDFYDLNPDAEDPILFDDDAEDVFYDQFGKVVNFKVLISQFYDRDEKVKAYVEKNLSSKRQAKKTEPKIEREEEAVEAEEKVEMPKPVRKTAKAKVEKVVEPTIDPKETEDEQVVEAKQIKPSKKTKKFDGQLGGLNYEVLTRDEWLQEYERATDGYKMAKRDRQVLISRIEQMSGAELQEKFGDSFISSTENSFYSGDREWVAKWALRIEELGIVTITSARRYSDNDSTKFPESFLKTNRWEIKLLLEPKQSSITKLQCDHASHFFGDTFFGQKVEQPFYGCQETSSSTKETPSKPANPYSIFDVAVNADAWSDKTGKYVWYLLTVEDSYRIWKNAGGALYPPTKVAESDDIGQWNKLKDFFGSEPFEATQNNRTYYHYPVVLAFLGSGTLYEDTPPCLFGFSFHELDNDRVTFYVHSYPFADSFGGKRFIDSEKHILNDCLSLQSFLSHVDIDMSLVSPCKKRRKRMKIEEKLNDCTSCGNDSSLSDDQSFDGLIDQLIEEHDIDLDVYDYDDYIIISRIVVPKNKRNEGIGTEVIEKILEYADDNDKDVFVTPTSDFGGSMTRLTKFYKSFGFVPNKGKYRDFRTRETMIRKNSTLDDHTEDMPTLFSGSNNVDLGKLENDDRHKAPYRDDEGFFSPAHDVSKAFPGIYSMSFSKALREYGTGNDSDPMALQIIRNIQDNPDAKVKIYRAVEKGLQDNIADLKQDRKYIKRNGSVPPWADVPPHSAEEYSAFVDSQIDNLGSVEGATIQASINPNEWVTITRQYAVDHGECCVPGGYTILTKTVKAKDLFTEGNSIHEWGYDPGNDTGLRDQSFMPPKDVQEEAERGLEWRREYNRGGTSVGVARARDLSNGKSVSYDTVKRMKAYFDRHSVDKDAQGFRQGEPGYPSAGRIAWSLWGGDAGYRWSKSIVSKQGLGEIDSNDQLSGKVLDTQEKEQSKEVAPLTTQEVINMDPPQTLPLKGEMRDFLSNLLAKFNMLIWGGAGSGKSSFVLRLANELAETNTGRVLYYMTEEKVSSGRLKARMDLMKAYSDNVNFDDHGTFDRLTALVNTGMYRYVIVDSINMINVEQQRIVDLMQTFPEVSWIFIAQATKGKNAYAGIQSLAHAVDTEISTANDKGTAVAELKKHRDGALKTHTIFGSTGMRDPGWQAQW